METLSFLRYNVAKIGSYILNALLMGAKDKNLSKDDLYPNPKPEVLYMIYTRVLQITVRGSSGTLLHDASERRSHVSTYTAGLFTNQQFILSSGLLHAHLPSE